MIRIVEYTGDANILKRLEIPQEDYDRVVKDIVEAVRREKTRRCGSIRRNLTRWRSRIS